MAFPVGPTDGQIYREYKYDGEVGAWELNNSIVSSVTISTPTQKSISIPKSITEGYTNLVTDPIDLTTGNWTGNITVSDSGQTIYNNKIWKVEAIDTSIPILSCADIDISISDIVTYSFIVRKGNTPTAAVDFYYPGHDDQVSINFDTNVVTSSGGNGTTISNSVWIDNETVEIYARTGSLTVASATYKLRIFASFTSTIGDYVYFSQPQVVKTTTMFPFYDGTKTDDLVNESFSLPDKVIVDVQGFKPLFQYDTTYSHDVWIWYLDVDKYFLLQYFHVTDTFRFGFYDRTTAAFISSDQLDDGTSLINLNQKFRIVVSADLSSGGINDSRMIMILEDGTIYEHTAFDTAPDIKTSIMDDLYIGIDQSLVNSLNGEIESIRVYDDLLVGSITEIEDINTILQSKTLLFEAVANEYIPRAITVDIPMSTVLQQISDDIRTGRGIQDDAITDRHLSSTDLVSATSHITNNITPVNTVHGIQLSTDTELGISDVLIPTQNAVKAYVDLNSGGGSSTTEGTLGETVEINKLVYFNTDGKMYLADNTITQKSFVVGFTLLAGVLDDVVDSQKAGPLDGFTGLTAGTDYYLGTAGNIVERSAVLTENIVYVGRAITTTELDINVQPPTVDGVIINQGDKILVGSIHTFPTYKDRTAYGYMPFAFDNAVNKVVYADLYAEVGDVYEAQHVAAGDPVSGVDDFYPTPIPGKYSRSAIPDLTIDGTALALPTIFRDGTLFLVKSGTDQAVGTELYIRRVDASTVTYHSSEAGAIANTLPVTVTGVGVLTQEGITIDDAVEEHTHTETEVYGYAGAVSDYYGGSANAYGFKTRLVNSGGVGTARSSNETRGTTFYEFYYIKFAEITDGPVLVTPDTDWIIGSTIQQMGNDIPTGTIKLNNTNQELLIADYPKVFANLGTKYGGDGIINFALPTIAQASGAEFIYEEFSRTNWTNLTININHSLISTKLRSKVEVRGTITGGKWVELGGTDYNDSASAVNSGYQIQEVDPSNVEFQTGNSGFSVLGDGTGSINLIDTETFDLRITITKDSPLPADVSLLMYVGNGSLSNAVDIEVDRRLTDLENQPIYSEVPYTTGMINRSDWTGVKLGDNDGKNVDSVVTLPFTYNSLSELDIKIIISTDGTLENSFNVFDSEYATPSINSWGMTVFAVDNNKIFIQTGTDGFLYNSKTIGTSNGVNTNDWYYEIVVRKTSAVPFIHARNAYVNHKDWVTIHEKYDNTSQIYSYPVPDGFYKVSLDNSSNSDARTAMIEIVNARAYSRGVYEPSYSLEYYSGNWNTALASYFVKKIDKWQRVTGSDRPSTPLKDGYETVWEGSLYTVPKADWYRGDGQYQISVINGTTSFHKQFPYVTGETPEGNLYNDASVNITYKVDSSGNLTRTGDLATTNYPFVKIEKFQGMYNLDVNHTNVHIEGDNSVLFDIDTDAEGDVVLDQGYFPYPIPEGYTITFANGGTGGKFLTTVDTDVLNLRDDIVVKNQEAIKFVGINGIWRMLGTHIVNSVIDKKDWVEVWTGSATSIPNSWGLGHYRFHIQDYVAGIDAVLDLGVKDFDSFFNSASTVSVGATDKVAVYHDANTFYLSTSGGYAGTIVSIERWQDTTGADRPSTKLTDGWELVYDNWANTADVPSTSLIRSGLGKYAIIMGDTITESTNYLSLVEVTNLGITSYGTSNISDGGGNMRALWSQSIQSFAAAYPGFSIKKIEKFNGIMNLQTERTYNLTHVSGTPEEEYHSLDTTLGDIDFTAIMAGITPSVGMNLTIFNAGTHAAANHVINCPGNVALGPQQMFKCKYNGSAWEYDRNQLIDHVDDGTWVYEKLSGGKVKIKGIGNSSGTSAITLIFPMTLIGGYYPSGVLIPTSSSDTTRTIKFPNRLQTSMDFEVVTGTGWSPQTVSILIDGYWKDPKGI